MIVLCLFLFSSDFASATLSVKNTISSSGLKDYRAVTDTVGINVTSTSAVSLDGVSCTKKTAITYVCAITDTQDAATATYELTNEEGDYAQASMKVDNNVGSISFTVTHTQGYVTLSYNLQDLGYNNNNACSGIKTLKVYSGTSVINTVNIAGKVGTCMYSGQLNLSVSGSGSKNISLEAIDNVGNVKKTSPPEEVMIDLSLPKISSGFTVKNAGTDNILTTIGGSASNVYVDIYFNIVESTLAKVTLDLSGVSSDPIIQSMYKEVDVPMADCEANDSKSSQTYDCHIDNVPLKLSGSTLNINVTATDSYNNIATAKLSKTFTVDSTVPSVTMKTSACDKNTKCYVHNGLNTIYVQLSKKNFKNEYVFVAVSGSVFGTTRVNNCTDGLCTAQVSLTCTNGEAVEASIGNYAGLESQDDSGNTIEPYAISFYCDNVKPEIKSINVTGTASALKDIISGSTIEINALVDESESDYLYASVWLDKLKNASQEGQCSRTSLATFNCSWTVTSIATGPYDPVIVVNVSDGANNTDSKSYKFRVFGYKTDNETPDNLAITLREVNPEKINRAVLGMASTNNLPYYVYATYDLSISHGKNVEVMYQALDISKCTYTGMLGSAPASLIFDSAKIMNSYSAVTDVGRIDFKFKSGVESLVNSMDDEFTVTCNISATVREGTYIYKKPQVLPLTAKFHTVGSKLCSVNEECTPGEELGRKIATVEDNFFVKNEFMGIMSKWIPKLQSICKMRDYVAMGSFAANAVSVATHSLSLIVGETPIAGQSAKLAINFASLDSCLSGASNAKKSTGTSGFLKKVGGSTDSAEGLIADKTAEEANDLLAGSSSSGTACGFFGQVCDFLNCNIAKDFNTTAEKGLTDLGSFDSIKDTLGRNVDVPDVKNSIIMSAYSGCLPAMYYNLDKYRQTECSYLYCLKTASYAGSDIAMCDKLKYSQYCSFVVGEIFEMPGARVLKNYMNNAADMVRNTLPLAATSVAKRTICKDYIDMATAKATLPPDMVTRSWKITMCQIPLQIARVTDMSMRSRRSGTFVYPEVTDMCAMAKCAGKTNCVDVPDVWDSLADIPVLNSSKNIANSAGVAANNDKAKLATQVTSDTTQLRMLLKLERDKASGKTLSAPEEAAYKTLVEQVEKKGIITDYGSNMITLKDNTVKSVDEINAQITALRAEARTKKGGFRPSGSTNVYYTYDSTGKEIEISEDDYKKLSEEYKSLNAKAEDLKSEINKKSLVSPEKQISAKIDDYNKCVQGKHTDCVKKFYSTYGKDPSEVESLNYELLKVDMTKPEYANLPVDQKLAIEKEKLQAYTELDNLNKKLTDSIKAESLTASGASILTAEELKVNTMQRVKLYESLGLCSGTTACAEYANKINTDDAELKKYAKTVTETRTKLDSNTKTYEKFQKAQKFGDTLFTALQYMRAAGVFKNMFKWYESSIFVKAADAIDFDKWKTSICNPDSAIGIDPFGKSSDGSVISCNSGTCQPVLTYAVERTQLQYPNGTGYYIYTVIYFISSGDLVGHNISYNIVLSGDGAVLTGHKNNVELSSYAITQKKSAFKSTSLYTKVCMKFTEAFPTHELTWIAKDEYCRSIREGVIDNGSPYSGNSTIVTDGTIATKGVMD